MTRDEARKLVSGYATGSLTELEKQLLFDEALDDQELFDELAGEQHVKELMELPGAKRRLLLALGPEKKRATWWPWAVGLAAAASLAVAVWVQWPTKTDLKVASVEVARVEPPPATEPAPTPAPQAATAAAADNRESEAKQTEAPLPAKEADAVAPPPPRTELALADRAKATVREETAPVPAQLETRAQAQLPILRPPLPSAAGAAKAALRAEAAQPTASPQAFVAGAPVASLAARPSVPNTLTYEVRNTGILRMTPSRAGVLEVTFDGRTLYPSRPVAAGVTIDVSIPLEAKQLRIDFANEFNAPNAAAQNAGVSGTLVLPESPNPRSVVVIPAQP